MSEAITDTLIFRYYTIVIFIGALVVFPLLGITMKGYKHEKIEEYLVWGMFIGLIVYIIIANPINEFLKKKDNAQSDDNKKPHYWPKGGELFMKIIVPSLAVSVPLIIWIIKKTIPDMKRDSLKASAVKNTKLQ